MVAGVAPAARAVVCRALYTCVFRALILCLCVCKHRDQRLMRVSAPIAHAVCLSVCLPACLQLASLRDIGSYTIYESIVDRYRLSNV
jgi:hypothetical protein